MIRLPSLVKAYDAVYSGDPALKQPPAKPDDKAPESELAAYKKAITDHRATIEACQETGDWSALTIEGQQPSKFVLGQIDRNIWRTISDRGSLPDSNPRHLGFGATLALLFRLALRDIPGLTDVKVEREPDPAWDNWTMAKPGIVTLLDMADPGIVTEIGFGIWKRLVDVSKKS